MSKKRLLLLETNFDVVKKYLDLLNKSVWKVEHKDSLNSFLIAVQSGEFDVAVVEGGIVPDSILLVILHSKPVIVCSDQQSDLDITRITRRFSGAELINTLEKVSFNGMDPEEPTSIEEPNSHEAPTLQEQVFENKEETAKEEAAVFGFDEEQNSVPSSWETSKREIREKSVDIEIEEPEKTPEPDYYTGEKAAAPEPEEKHSSKGIFEKINKMDSIIMNLKKSVVDKQGETEEEKQHEVLEWENPEVLLDNLLSDDNNDTGYLSDNNKSQETQKEEKSEADISDISDICIEKDEDNYGRMSNFKSTVSKGYKMLDKGGSQKSLMDIVESSTKKNRDVKAEKEVEKESREFHGTESIKVKEPAWSKSQPVQQGSEKTGEAFLLADDMLKNEFRTWLDKNARSIVKEVVEEQLKKLYSGK